MNGDWRAFPSPLRVEKALAMIPDNKLKAQRQDRTVPLKTKDAAVSRQ
jgi:hypothetical protein